MNELLPSISGQLNNSLASLYYFQPELCLIVLFLLVLAVDLVWGRKSASLCRAVSCLGLLMVITADYSQYLTSNGTQLLFSNMLILHHSVVVFKLIIDALAIMLLLYFPWDKQLKSHRKGLSDAYTIVIGSILGLHLMLMAANLLSIYLAVEMVSIASYLLVAYQTERALSAEASLKFVLFGMASSAVLLYGISLIYAFTGTLELFNGQLIEGLQHINSASMVLVALLVFAGVGFKLGYVPLHFWVPDVYQGSATPVMAYISTLPKVGAFGLLVNLLNAVMSTKDFLTGELQLFLSIIAIITMVVGNFAAVWQTDVKRILAYSSIGHTGFALMGVLNFTSQGISALAFYLLVYAIANICALALATYFKNVAGAENVEDYDGLGIQYPVASICFVIILISLTGLPVTAGFNGKLLLFSATSVTYQHTHHWWLLALLITGAVTTVVSLFYYLKLPLHLFLRKSKQVVTVQSTSVTLTMFCLFLVLIILALGVFPSWIAQLL